MGLITPTLPTTGDDRGTEEVDILNTLTTIVNAFNGNVDASNLASSAKPATLLGTRRKLAEVVTITDSGDSSGLKFVAFNSTDGFGLTPNGTTGLPVEQFIYFDPADHTVSGLTTRLRTRIVIAANAAPPGAFAYTAGLYPITSSGTIGNIGLTLGTVVSGSTAVLTHNTANAILAGTGSDFAPPVAGAYALGVNLAGVPAAGCKAIMWMSLDVHHI